MHGTITRGDLEGPVGVSSSKTLVAAAAFSSALFLLEHSQRLGEQESAPVVGVHVGVAEPSARHPPRLERHGDAQREHLGVAVPRRVRDAELEAVAKGHRSAAVVPTARASKMKIDRWILEVHQQRRHRCIRRRVGIPGQTSGGDGSGGEGGASVRGIFSPQEFIWPSEQTRTRCPEAPKAARARQCLALDFRRGEVFAAASE